MTNPRLVLIVPLSVPRALTVALRVGCILLVAAAGQLVAEERGPTPDAAQSQAPLRHAKLATELVQEFQQRVSPVLTGYCVDCHNSDYNEGGVVLDRYDPDMVRGKDAEHWSAALDMINAGDMPPGDVDQPTAAERDLLVNWITRSLSAAREARRDVHQPRLRRLTKRQYANTLKDLLGLPIEFGENLPSDSPSGMGFTNSAATQQTTALHLEYYEAVAREALSKAIVIGPRPDPVRYRVRLGLNAGASGDALEISGFQAKAVAKEDVAVEVLDDTGQPIEPGDREAERRLREVQQNIGVDMRGSTSERYAMSTDGMVLYSALPHVERAPFSWQGPSPNLKVLLRRVAPSAGPFALRVTAAYAPSATMVRRRMAALGDERPVAVLDEQSRPVAEDGVVVLAAADFQIGRNLAHVDGVLRSQDVTKASSAKATLHVEQEGVYQLDLVHPVEMEAAMPSIGLQVNRSTEHVQLSSGSARDARELAVTPLVIVRLKQGENSVRVRNKFFGGLHSLVATRLPEGHPNVTRLVPQQRTDESTADAPSIRVFAGTRTDDGMEYRTFGESTRVVTPPGEAAVYEFHDYLENLPVPNESAEKEHSLSSILLLGVWNDCLANRREEMGPPLLIKSVEFVAPYYQQWPPASHKMIFFDDPARLSDQDAYTREVIRRFAARAFRRDVTDEELDRYVRYWRAVRDDFEHYEQGVREALVAVLCSPSFLYLSQPAPHQDGAPHYELASKIAYFLWDSPPDQRLLERAESGELAEQLPSTVEWMLADPRARRFVKTFAAEWLRLDRHESMSINTDRFPRYNRFVKADMREETFAFLHHALANNLSARVLIDSDFAMLNQHLAEFYGVAGVKGSQFRPVELPRSMGRGGLLSQGAFLTGHSDGTHSHPIKRAVWLKERILGDPPPPAAPQRARAGPRHARF